MSRIADKVLKEEDMVSNLSFSLSDHLRILNLLNEHESRFDVLSQLTKKDLSIGVMELIKEGHKPHDQLGIVNLVILLLLHQYVQFFIESHVMQLDHLASSMNKGDILTWFKRVRNMAKGRWKIGSLVR